MFSVYLCYYNAYFILVEILKFPEINTFLFIFSLVNQITSLPSYQTNIIFERTQSLVN